MLFIAGSFCAGLFLVFGCENTHRECGPQAFQIVSAATNSPIANAEVLITEYSGASQEEATVTRTYEDTIDSSGILDLTLCWDSRAIDFVNTTFESDLRRIEIVISGSDNFGMESITLRYEPTYFNNSTHQSGLDVEIEAAQGIEVTLLPYYPYP